MTCLATHTHSHSSLLIFCMAALPKSLFHCSFHVKTKTDALRSVTHTHTLALSSVVAHCFRGSTPHPILLGPPSPSHSPPPGCNDAMWGGVEACTVAADPTPQPGATYSVVEVSDL
jgi:hypothetical protein